MLGDIFCITQLLVIHLVMTFSVGDSHDIRGIYLTCIFHASNKMSMLSRSVYLAGISGQTERENIPRAGCTKCHQACDGRNNCLSITSVAIPA